MVVGVAWRSARRRSLWWGVSLYMLLLILLGAANYAYRLRNPIEQKDVWYQRTNRFIPYWSILGRFLLAENKVLLIGIKLFSCLTLYAMLHTQTPDDYDLRLPYLVFILALFGHGLLLYRCGELETTRGLWYRNLPVPRIRRFIQIALFAVVADPGHADAGTGWTPDPIRISGQLVLLACPGYSIIALCCIWAPQRLRWATILNYVWLSFGIVYAVCWVILLDRDVRTLFC